MLVNGSINETVRPILGYWLIIITFLKIECTLDLCLKIGHVSKRKRDGVRPILGYFRLF